GAAERDGPAPERAEGPEDVPILEGVGGTRVDDALHAVELQLLLAGADARGQGRGGPMAPEDAGDGGGADRPRLDACGVGHPTRHSTVEGQHRGSPAEEKPTRTP